MSYLSSWQTILDMDFTVQGTQTLSGNATYTIGGLKFTKENSANETANCTLNSSGISFTPSSGGDLVNGTRSFPLLFLPFSQLSIPNLDWSTGIRAYAYISSANQAGNYDNTILAIGNDSTDWYYAALRGYNGSQGLWMRRTISGGTSTTGVYSATLSNSAFQVISVTVDSLWGNICHGNLTTQVVPPWPSAVRPMYSVVDSTGSQVDGYAGNANSPGGMGVWFGAMRPSSGTAFVSTIARLRIDYHL